MKLPAWIQHIIDIFAPHDDPKPKPPDPVPVDPVPHPTPVPQGCTCDLSKPIIKQHGEKGHLNDHEGNRAWRLLTHCDITDWIAIDPKDAWIKGCVKEENGYLIFNCNPATGAHFHGVHPKSASAPMIQDRKIKSQSYDRVKYERRQL